MLHLFKHRVNALKDLLRRLRPHRGRDILEALKLAAYVGLSGATGVDLHAPKARAYAELASDQAQPKIARSAYMCPTT